MSGNKFDDGKPALALLSAPFILEMGAVLEFGARKYAVQNWRQGIGCTRLLSAAMRHLFKWTMGEEKDEESGLSHLAHSAIDIMFAFEEAKYRPSFDDRYKLVSITNGQQQEPDDIPF